MQNNKHYVCGKISKTCNYKIAVQPKQFRVAHLIRCIIELCVYVSASARADVYVFSYSQKYSKLLLLLFWRSLCFIPPCCWCIFLLVLPLLSSFLLLLLCSQGKVKPFHGYKSFVEFVRCVFL